jgi:hypothetical protein
MSPTLLPAFPPHPYPALPLSWPHPFTSFASPKLQSHLWFTSFSKINKMQTYFATNSSWLLAVTML